MTVKPKSLVAAVAATALLLTGGTFLWARSVLTGDAVRATVAKQLSDALGQPVTIGGISASVLPRVTMNLTDVAIGEPARVTVARLRVGTALGALLSRRIEHADLLLDDAHVELPLPFGNFGADATSPEADGEAPAVQLVSVDEIRLANVEIVSGGRTLRGDAELTWDRGAVTITRADLGIGDAAISIAGQITDVAAPTGTLRIAAGDLGVLELVEFFSDFSAGGGTASEALSASAQPSSATLSPAMDLTLTMEAERAHIGTLALESLSGQARVTSTGLTIEPLAFTAFGGRVEGSLAFALGATPTFTLAADMSNVDVGAAMAFVDSPDTLSGIASGRLDLVGQGVTADEAMRSTRGTARLDVVDGAVKGLGLVRTVVLASSMRAESQVQVATTRPDGSFSALGLTVQIDRGTAHTSDLMFESPDVLLRGAGTIQLASTVVNLAADVQLSEALSSSAGRDLVRYTQQDGRVTLPATVTGPVDALAVRLDAADATRRAVTNRAAEEARKTLTKGIGRIIRRR